ncbi:glutamate receptor ionotropic, kainate 2-like isoform X2 [Pararge aegeria]|uniref:glutamate receptor ionotropic, kainate 2-like isoform X2 n=1 Tax=Pararge aegeria TaxID=116150 RepID=UPI0019D08D5A|nr:glutamate receptor ionotropic, kainate 2-like isoform X2 [Pararge aegeria]
MEGINMMLFTTLLIFGTVRCAFRNFETLKISVNIGVILPQNTVTEVAFASALARASMESEHYNFAMKIVYVPYGDSFAASKAACELLAIGVIAIYGPIDSVSTSAVEARCRAARVPHIQAVWRPPYVRGLERPSPPGINLYPEAVALSKAVALFIKDNDWDRYTLLYDDDHGLIRLQEILKHADPSHKWVARRLKRGEDNRQLLKALKAYGESRVIIDCPSERVLHYLRQAFEVKFFEDYMSYVLISLDAHTLDLQELRYGLSNVTCLRIFDHSDSRTRSYLADWKARTTPDIKIPHQTHEITVEAALASDAARLITDAVESAPDEFKIEPQSIECGSDTPWEIGEEFINHLLTKADLAICDLTITYERRAAVDFTTPFMTLGISILYSKPTPPEPELFSFLKPFSVDVWIYMAAAYLMVSLFLHILARLAPSDWENPHPCDKSPEELENIWHIKNCCWLTMGSIMTQGSDILPKGYSTRWVCGMWWFFALIMCSSYTANLAAFLTNAAMDDSIKSVDDLASQTKIKYGTLKGGATSSFFRRSNVSTFQKMWAAMESARPSVFVKNNDEGLERVLKGKRSYAFLMESTAIEYQLERHCDLMQVGGLLDSKGFGIAMPFSSSYRTAVDNAVLKLAESGKLVELKNRWWKVPEDEACVTEEATEEGASAAELGVDNVGGVFVVLGIGCGMAAAMGGLEFLWHVRDVAVEQKMTPSEAFWAELTFALSFWETEKPVQHDRSSSSGSNSNIASRASSVIRSAVDLFHLDVFNK